MSTPGVESASFQTFSMADDSMEISSEHGGLNANDDIDIDIDFTAGPNDEDYMLEDVESDVEFRESFETAPHTTNDDIMVEDYNSLLLMEEQHDGDYDEQLQDIPDESLDVPEMELSNNDPRASDHTDRRDSDHRTQVPVSNVHVQLEDAVENVPLDLNEATSPQHLETETLLPAVSPNSNIHSGLPTDTSTAPDSPYNLINEDETKNSSEQEKFVEDGHGSFTSGDHHGDHQVEPVAARDDPATADEAEAEATEEVLNEENTHTVDMDETYTGIMVSYQDTQYALFSSSDDDDSDSFFLKDRSITQEPISSFLKALRDILQEELADDEELCIAIDVLRLEFGEVRLMRT